MRRRKWLGWVAGVVVCGPALGCGGGSGGPVTVRGQVTADGKPLDKGVVSFSNGVHSATATVENGSYQLQAQPGPNRVQISAPVVVRQVKEYDGPNAPMMDISEESLPDKYNAKSDLSFDVPAGGGTKDWAVERKPTAAKK